MGAVKVLEITGNIGPPTHLELGSGITMVRAVTALPEPVVTVRRGEPVGDSREEPTGDSLGGSPWETAQEKAGRAGVGGRPSEALSWGSAGLGSTPGAPCTSRQCFCLYFLSHAVL